jgi:prepilin-type N-terminal cleavage/methylation domain-containing protein
MNKTFSTSERLRAPFTLVELLVVIAIISILAGMLLPALENAIGNARQISCLSNTKQLALFPVMYAEDYSDYVPPHSYGFQLPIWLVLLGPYFPDGPDPRTFMTAGEGVIFCPEVNDTKYHDRYFSTNPSAGNINTTRRLGYGYNKDLGSEWGLPAKPEYFRKISRIAPDTLLMGDLGYNNAGYYSVGHSFSHPEWNVYPIHLNIKANINFIDGSARSYNAEELHPLDATHVGPMTHLFTPTAD